MWVSVAWAGDAGSVAGTVDGPGREAWVYLVPKGPDPGPAGAGEAEIRQVGDNPPRFSTSVLVVPRGTTVHFPNDGPPQHNVHWLAESLPIAVPGISEAPAGDDLGTYGVRESRSRALDVPGLYSVGCKFHENMHAVLLVVPNTWFARVVDGAYRIDGVPPGAYWAVAWTPTAFSAAEVNVRAGEAARFEWSWRVR